MTYPERHRNHEIETLSDRYLKNNIPISWVVNSFTIDYGTDYNCEVSIDGKVSGINFTVQLKGKETDNGKDFITIKKIKRTTINRWIRRLEPTMIVVYLVDENEAYWCWFEMDLVDLTKKNKTFQIKIPRENSYSKIDWNSVSSYLEEIFKRKNLLYKVPESSSNNDAWELYLNKEFDKALPIFKDFSKTHDNAIIWNALAVCNYELFHYREALIAINKAIELKSDNILILNKASILTEFGSLNKDQKMLLNAIELYNKLIESGEVSDTVFFNYSNALKGVGDFEGAERFLVETLKINPNYAQAWKNLGTIYWEFRLHDKEIQCYDKALRIEPNLQEALFSKGVTIFKVYGKTQEGLELMIKSTKISDRYMIDFPYAYFWIAEAFLELDRLDLALEWNVKGLDNNPSDEYLLIQNERIKQR